MLAMCTLGQSCINPMANLFGSQRDLLTFDDQLFDHDWDGLWRVRTSRTDTTWLAEFAIS